MTVRQSIRCPKCSQHVLQKSSDGGIRFRLKGKITSDDKGLHANCYWCGTAVTLPLDVALRPASSPGSRLLLKAATPGKSST